MRVLQESTSTLYPRDPPGCLKLEESAVILNGRPQRFKTLAAWYSSLLPAAYGVTGFPGPTQNNLNQQRSSRMAGAR